MKRFLLLIAAIALLACEGRLTDEQKKRIKEEMRAGTIRKVTDAELTEAAYAEGRSIMRMIAALEGDSLRIDSLIRASRGTIRLVRPGSANASGIERQLVDAYLATETGAMPDNVQKIRRGTADTDSILYTRPVTTTLADGSERLEGVWNIWLSRKAIILAMDER